MNLPRREFLQVAGAAVAAPAYSRIATAQNYPTRPISMIAAGTPGGPTDAIGRVLAERLRGSLGQPIIVENVGGAGGTIGAGRVARATPDGYTIDLGFIGTHVLNGALYSLQYDVLNDFAPISPLSTNPLILFARKTIPAKVLGQLIAWLKANSNKASAGFAAPGPRVVTALFQKETGTQFAHVPYRGTALAVQDVVAGQIDFTFGGTDSLSLMRAGSIKAYAVTSDMRLAQAPELPTVGEMGLPALSYSAWYGLFAPRDTPRDIIDKLNAAAVEALADPAVQSQLVELGMEIFPRERQTPEALGALVKADAEKWWRIIKELGIKGQ